MAYLEKNRPRRRGFNEFTKWLAQSIDQTFLTVVLGVLGDRNGIRGLLFHSVFLDEDEIATEHILPQQALTLEHYRWIFEYFLRTKVSSISATVWS